MATSKKKFNHDKEDDVDDTDEEDTDEDDQENNFMLRRIGKFRSNKRPTDLFLSFVWSHSDDENVENDDHRSFPDTLKKEFRSKFHDFRPISGQNVEFFSPNTNRTMVLLFSDNSFFSNGQSEDRCPQLNVTRVGRVVLGSKLSVARNRQNLINIITNLIKYSL